MHQHRPAIRAALGSALLVLAGCGGSGSQPPASNIVAGERIFLQCRACHTVKAGEPHGVGPNLAAVFGAKAGTRRGFEYSPEMAKSTLIWDMATLDRFIERPSAVVPGTRMAFAGVADPKARASLIAYLESLEGARP